MTGRMPSVRTVWLSFPPLRYIYICIYLFFNHLNHILSLVDFDVDDMFPLYLKDECFMRLHDVACIHSMEHVERYLGHT